MPTISIRGSKGLNLAVHAAEFDPADADQASYLYSCRNVDLSLEKAVLPRLGMQRVDSWAGLLYADADGKLYTGVSGLTGPITVLFPNPSAYTAKPGVVA